jgi:hypothetical protein
MKQGVVSEICHRLSRRFDSIIPERKPLSQSKSCMIMSQGRITLQASLPGMLCKGDLPGRPRVGCMWRIFMRQRSVCCSPSPAGLLRGVAKLACDLRQDLQAAAGKGEQAESLLQQLCSHALPANHIFTTAPSARCVMLSRICLLQSQNRNGIPSAYRKHLDCHDSRLKIQALSSG